MFIDPLAMNKKNSFFNVVTLLLCASFFLFSCGNIKNLQYMQGSFDTAKIAHYTLPVPVIQKGDLLSIIVYSDNPAATLLYNQSSGNVTGVTVQGGAQTTGYLVDEEGNIEFQGIGRLHVDSLTKTQLIALLNSKLKEFLQNPYYNIRFLNYKITLVGDVARPGAYTIPSERVNIMEAIGLAGDLNITARRDNILVVREQNGKRSFGRIDITKPDIFNNPFYQLQQNDMIYVDLGKQKIAASDQTTFRNISIATSIISTIAIVYSIIRVN
jgi:polysaccharide biosynthesis/export protein